MLHLKMIVSKTDRTKIPGGHFQLSNEKNPGWLGSIGDYTTQLYRDYKKPLEGSL